MMDFVAEIFLKHCPSCALTNKLLGIAFIELC
jgi:hypothetical protein